MPLLGAYPSHAADLQASIGPTLQCWDIRHSMQHVNMLCVCSHAITVNCMEVQWHILVGIYCS